MKTGNPSVSKLSHCDDNQHGKRGTKWVTYLFKFIAFTIFGILAFLTSNTLRMSIQSNQSPDTQHLSPGEMESSTFSLEDLHDSLLSKLSSLEKEVVQSSTKVKDLQDEIVRLESKAFHKISVLEAKYSELKYEESGQSNEYQKNFGGTNHNAESPLSVLGSSLNDSAGSVSSYPLTSKNSQNLIEIEVSDSSNMGRNLQNLGVVPDFRPCTEDSILTPINRANGFEYDEKIGRILSIARGISSAESLLEQNSPQHQALCWMIYNQLDEFEIDHFLIQTYVLAIFYFEFIFPLRIEQTESSALVNKICALEHFECGDDGFITSMDLSGEKFLTLLCVLNLQLCIL